MEIQFVKTNPTQNMTILVQSEVPRAQQPLVASALMAYDSVYAEQAGFIERPVDSAAWARLQMAGGEFCGNATMSLAALLAWERGIAPGKTAEVPLEASGVDGILTCAVEMHTNSMRATVEMPPPQRIEQRELSWKGKAVVVAVVYFSGITHIIVPVEAVNSAWMAFAEQTVHERPNWVHDDAMGVLLYDGKSARMDPLVSVRASGTTVWERGCGSGTAAVGAWLAHGTDKSVKADIHQPGGTITVQAHNVEGMIQRVAITGTVQIAARGTAYICLR